MFYLYTICGIRILCEIPFTVHMQRESEEFLSAVHESAGYDLKMCFSLKDRFTEWEAESEEGHWENDRLYIEKGDEQRVYYCPVRGRQPYARVTWPGEGDARLLCEYISGAERYMDYSHNLCSLIGLETFLLRYGGLLLHAAFIQWNGSGILFSAPSGTGKSTQADLWAHYEQADILNGDRAGIRRIEGEWRAFGLPLAGSSSIYKNESAPLTELVVLRQGAENRIRRLRGAEAFRYLYPETSVHCWHRPSAEKAASLLMQLVSEVPVRLLECRPDEGAVRLLKKTITDMRSA